MFTFYCVLPNGRKNSISTVNVFEAPRRARALGALKLFRFDFDTRKATEIAF